jgi:hypothetical protein
MGLVEISLKDAITHAKLECPICSLVDKALDSTIDSLLYEMVNDVTVRSELRSKGLCRRHVARIEAYLSRHMELGYMGLAIIYSDLLEHLAELLETIPIWIVARVVSCARRRGPSSCCTPRLS